MFDRLKTPYSFAFEIWQGGKGFQNHKNPKHAAMLESSSAVHRVLHRISSKRSAAAAAAVQEVDARDADQLSLGSCFIQKREHERNAHEHEHEQEQEQDRSGALFPRPSTVSKHTCLASFNPTNTADYIATTDNWSRALLELVHSVREDRAAAAQTADA